MRKYIVDLTNHLIAKNRYYTYPFDTSFIGNVQLDLEAGEVGIMSPEKLGEIMCSFEVGDVMASKAELLGSLYFSGDCEELQRELVALCLAHVIRGRLDINRHSSIPPYNGPFISKRLFDFPGEHFRAGRVFGPPW